MVYHDKSSLKSVKFAQKQKYSPRMQKFWSKYADRVLYYMSKLKSYRNSMRSLSNSGNRTHKTLTKSILQQNKKIVEPLKAKKIVNAAINFGCQNGIIENVGDYFLVKKKSNKRIAQRRPTPGPDFVRCSNCENLAPLPGKLKMKPKVFDRMNTCPASNQSYDGFDVDKKMCDVKPKPCCCSKCRFKNCEYV